MTDVLRFQFEIPDQDAAMRHALAQLSGLPGLRAVQAQRILWLQEKTPGALAGNPAAALADVMGAPATPGHPRVSPGHSYIEIAFRPGVTDNAARAATQALMAAAGERDDCAWPDWGVSVLSGWQLELDGTVDRARLQELLQRDLVNPLLHTMQVDYGSALLEDGWFAMPRLDMPQGRTTRELQRFRLEFAALDAVNRERGLALSADEIHAIIAHFKSKAGEREALGWAGTITEVELECIAQTWSEHCKHKIFAAQIDYSEADGDFPALGSQRVDSLYRTFIQRPTRELADRCGYLVSVFSDNAGVVDFDPHLNVCVKAETHNSPSALDPYGGAMTGILGVHRDILGTGLGAQPVANMDVFCLATSEQFPPADDPRRPQGLKDPAVIFRGVHRGAAEGGNGSGVPTINGSLRFASEYGGKPLVFVGSVGVSPKQVAGRDSAKKEIRPGDRIVVAGGRVGRDGVHGATFSSLALADEVAPNTVQIGDAATQKRLAAFTLAARDRGWVRALTDNGAGGLSSSVGEMAELSGGARLDLARHGTKYSGLQYWEILISESQERMSYAVAPEHEVAFLELARSMGVEAWVLGTFTDSGYFELHHDEVEVARLALDFLHDGVPRMQLRARYAGPQPHQPWWRKHAPRPASQDLQSLPGALQAVLAHPNVASRGFMVAAYDQQAMGATRLGSFAGSQAPGTPTDAGVINLGAHGGAAGNALVLGHGLCPQLSWHDTWLMAQQAVDMAVRKVVAVGANPARIALLDNFCWPDPLEHEGNPDAQHKLGQLVRACAGLADAAHAFGAPFVSGKDSMKNDYVGRTQGGEPVKISIAPTLLVTAIAQNDRIATTVTPEFKSAGDLIYLVGRPGRSAHGSTWAELYQAPDTAPDYPDLRANAIVYQQLHAAMQAGLLRSCRSVDVGGLLATIAQCCFGERLGMELTLDDLQWSQLFSETGSALLASVSPARRAEFEGALAGHILPLGRTTEAFTLVIDQHGATSTLNLDDLLTDWRQGVQQAYES